VLDVVVERVAIADAFQRKSGDGWDKLGQLGFGRGKTATEMRC
jgi:hypothetical protein